MGVRATGRKSLRATAPACFGTGTMVAVLKQLGTMVWAKERLKTYIIALYNIRKIRPFLSEQAAQLLVQALVLSRLDYCNALLAGLPACTIKPLQLIQNAAARVVFNEPKKSSRYPSLHQVTLATNSRSHQIQGTDVCLQDHNWHCTNIPKLASSNLCALQKLAFCK